MKASEFEVGAAIITINDTYTGKIIGNNLTDGDQVVAVEWANGNLEKVNINDIKKVNVELEVDYALIKEKVAHAAMLLGESNDLAKKYHTDLSSMNEINCYGLFRALSDAGWSTSSMSC